MSDHELIDGKRYPACTIPDDPRSIYEVTCKCGIPLSSYSWDTALDAYLYHHAWHSMDTMAGVA